MYSRYFANYIVAKQEASLMKKVPKKSKLINVIKWYIMVNFLSYTNHFNSKESKENIFRRVSISTNGNHNI